MWILPTKKLSSKRLTTKGVLLLYPNTVTKTLIAQEIEKRWKDVTYFIAGTEEGIFVILQSDGRFDTKTSNGGNKYYFDVRSGHEQSNDVSDTSCITNTPYYLKWKSFSVTDSLEYLLARDKHYISNMLPVKLAPYSPVCIYTGRIAECLTCLSCIELCNCNLPKTVPKWPSKALDGELNDYLQQLSKWEKYIYINLARNKFLGKVNVASQAARTSSLANAVTSSLPSTRGISSSVRVTPVAKPDAEAANAVTLVTRDKLKHITTMTRLCEYYLTTRKELKYNPDIITLAKYDIDLTLAKALVSMPPAYTVAQVQENQLRIQQLRVELEAKAMSSITFKMTFIMLMSA